jgi:hypothetical protein
MQIYRDAPNAKFTAIVYSNACGITMSFIRYRIFESIKGSVRNYIHSITILDRRIRSCLKHISSPQNVLKLRTLFCLHCTSIFSMRFAQNFCHSDKNTARNARKNECTFSYQASFTLLRF